MRKNPDGTYQLVESVTDDKGRGTATVAVDPGDAAALAQHLDVSWVRDALRQAIAHVESGDGRSALAETADAFARLAFFVR